MIGTNHGNSSENLLVRGLINEGFTGWNEELIQQLFDHVEVKRILFMPFLIHMEDCLAWKYEKIGLYSTKSSYVKAMKTANRAYCSSLTDLDRKWRWRSR